MLTVTSRATTYDLTVLAAVKAELGITDRADDEKLTGYIRQASNAVAKFCNRVFARETVSESFRFKRRTEDLILSRYPVTAVASVVENDTTLAEADYERDDDSGVLLRLRSGGQSCWPPGLVTVVYTAGYALLSDLPYGIERAAILLVKQYASAGDRDPLIRSEAVEGAGSTEYFSTRGTGLPPEVEGLLTPHRKPSIIG